MPPTSSRLYGLAAKVETTYGTDSVPTFAADAIRLSARPDFDDDALAPNPREDFASGSLNSPAKDSPAGRFHAIDFETIMHGAGSAYSSSNLPVPAPFMKAAGFSETVDATPGSENVIYDPSDAPSTGISVYLEFANKRTRTLGGVLESMRFAVDAGEFPLLSGRILGLGTAPTELALETATYPTTAPPKFANATMTIGAATLVIRGFELDFGLTVAPRGDGNATDAHAGYRIVRRQPTIIVRAETEALTTWDPWGDMNANTLRALSFTLGSTQYNKYTMTAADMRVMDVTPQDLDGLEIIEATYRMYAPASGNEFRWLFD